MSKKVKNTLTAALTATIATGAMSIPAFAAENSKDVAELYKAAYEATIATEKDNASQAEINTAREAIAALKDTAAKDAVPTFSSIVDKAQQKFLTVAYNSIVECQKTGTQKDVNTARTNIKDLPAEFKNAYSMAIDEVQKVIINNAVAAVEKAEKTQSAADVKAAQALIDELKTAEDNKGVTDWATAYEKDFKEATAKLTMVSAEALNNNSVKVVFNKKVDAKTIIADNFSVTVKGASYNNLYVQSAKVSEDGMSATLTVLNNFDNKGEYVVNTSNIKAEDGAKLVEKASAGFTYEVAAVKSIAFTTTNIPTSANLKDYVIIRDAKDRDVTAEYKDKLSFTSSNTNVTIDGNEATTKATVDKNNTVMVGVTVNGTDVKTSALITVSKSAAASFDGFAVIKTDYEVGTKTLSEIPAEDRLAAVTVGQTDAKLVVEFKDQFGKEITLNDAKFVVEHSSNPEVAIVKDNGAITALSAGTTYVTVKSGNIEKTVAIQVQAASLATSINAKANYNLVATNTNGINIDYTVANKDGNKFTGAQGIEYKDQKDIDTNKQDEAQYVNFEVKDSNGNVLSINEANSKFNVVCDSKNNQITISPVGDVNTGLYTLKLTKKFKYKGKTTTLTKEIAINVVNGGSVNGYNVKVSNTNLDVFAGNIAKTPNTSNITVYEVDAQGNELGLAKGTTIEVFNSNGVKVDAKKVKVEGTNNATLTAEDSGTYTVKVKVGSYLVKQLTLNIVDTKAEVSTITFNSKSTTVDSEKTINDILTKIGAQVKDQFGNTLEVPTTPKDSKTNEISGINYDIANESGVSINDQNELTDSIKWEGTNVNGDKVTQGSFDLLINSITVNKDKKTDGSYNTKTIYFSTPVMVKVTVNESANNKATKAAQAAFDAEVATLKTFVNADGTAVAAGKTAQNVKDELAKVNTLKTDKVVVSTEVQTLLDNAKTLVEKSEAQAAFDAEVATLKTFVNADGTAAAAGKTAQNVKDELAKVNNLKTDKVVVSTEVQTLLDNVAKIK